MKRNPFVARTVRKRPHFGPPEPKDHAAEVRLVLMHLPDPRAETVHFERRIVDGTASAGLGHLPCTPSGRASSRGCWVSHSPFRTDLQLRSEERGVGKECRSR